MGQDHCIRYALKFKNGGYHKRGHATSQWLGYATLYDSIEELEMSRKGYEFFDELQNADIVEVKMCAKVLGGE